MSALMFVFMFMLIFVLGTKHSAAPGSGSQNAATTSLPTSNTHGPIAGPSHASTDAGSILNSATAASITPAASPRQPACAAATTRESRSASRTGRQSAVKTAQTVPGVRVTEPSAANPPYAASRSAIAAPCTCLSHTGLVGTKWRSNSRPFATRGADAAKSMARPAAPFRVVESACTRDGAGHSGTIQSRPRAASAAAIVVSFLTGGITRAGAEHRAAPKNRPAAPTPTLSLTAYRDARARDATHATPAW